MQIRTAESDTDIDACYSVMAELRPHLIRSEFVERVRRLGREDYHLAHGIEADTVVAVAGFRFMEKLVCGPTLYIDDLVTRAAARSRGHGHELLAWLVARARERGCRWVELDSGVQRFDAHRFYSRERMAILSHHFVLEV
jgi:GNAT superfamily N-acetyltransferase